MLIRVVAWLAVAVPALSQPSILSSFYESVKSRWEFQQAHPGSAKLFANQASAGDGETLLAKLRADNSQPAVSDPTTATFDELWMSFTKGLAAEKSKPGAGEEALRTAAAMARGNIAVNYELARILASDGMILRAKAFQQEVQRSMLERGYVRVPELAKLELRNARASVANHAYALARQQTEFAARLDPFSPWPSLLLAEVKWRESPFLRWDLSDLYARVWECLRMARYYDTQGLLLLNLSRGLRAGLGLFGCLAVLALFARHFARIAHPWVERLPAAVEQPVRYAALALAPLSLAVAGAGGFALCLAGVMLLWRHCSSQERSLLKLVLSGMAIVPFLLIWEKSMYRHLDVTLGVNLYHDAYARGCEDPLLKRIADFHPRTHEDSLFRDLAASLAYKKVGNYPEAATHAREASRIDGESPYSIMNIGNLAMVRIDYPAARAAYGKARDAAPEMMETWFNSSQAELYSNNSSQHKVFLDHAAEIDAAWLTQYLKDNDENFPAYPANRKAMDPMLRSAQAWEAAWKSFLGLDALRVPTDIGDARFPGAWILGAVGFAALGLYFRFRHYSQHTHGRDLFECKICGRIMCRSCRKGVHCQGCFKSVSTVQDNRLKLELVAHIRTRAARSLMRVGAAGNILVPGFGDLYLGRGSARFLWLLAACLLAGCLWQTNHLVMEYPALALGPARWFPVAPLLVCYAVYYLKLLRNRVDIREVIATALPGEKEQVR